MDFPNTVFVGIDPTSGRDSFTYALLDHDLNLIMLAEGALSEIAASLDGRESVVVAVNAPSGVNRGIVRMKLEGEMRKPHQIRGADLRMAEYSLREHGIAVSGTPASIAQCAAWVQLGFEIYLQFESSGYKKYPQAASACQILETHPHACYCVMAGKTVLSKPSLEGRMQRQLILYGRGLQIPDPMDFFEEVTRFKLSNGIWPMELLYVPEQLDALRAEMRRER